MSPERALTMGLLTGLTVRGAPRRDGVSADWRPDRVPPPPADGTLDRFDVWTPVCRLATGPAWDGTGLARMFLVSRASQFADLAQLAGRARARIWDPEGAARLPISFVGNMGHSVVETMRVHIRPHINVTVRRNGRHYDLDTLDVQGWVQLRVRFAFHCQRPRDWFARPFNSITADLRDIWVVGDPLHPQPTEFFTPGEVR